jgi:hypothetical protein
MKLVYGSGNETKNELYPYYHNPLAAMLPGKQDIRGILQIPITEERNKFQVYRVVPFPARSHGSQNKQRFRWTGIETHVAMTEDGKKYTELGPWFSQKMCLPGPPMVCPARMAFSTNSNEKCLHQLLTGKVNKEGEQCPFEDVEEKTTEIQAINEVEWIVSTNEKLPVKANCLEIGDLTSPIQKLPRFTVNGEMILVIPKHCTATIGSYLIPLRLRITSGANEIQSQIKGFKLPIEDLLKAQGETLQEHRIQQTFVDTYQELLLLGKNLSTKDMTSEEVYQIIAKMSNVDEEIRKLQPVWVTHYMSFGGWVVLIAIITIALALAIRFRQKILSWTTDFSSIVPIEDRPVVYHAPSTPEKSPRVAWVSMSPRRARTEEEDLEISSV